MRLLIIFCQKQTSLRLQAFIGHRNRGAQDGCSEMANPARNKFTACYMGFQAGSPIFKTTVLPYCELQQLSAKQNSTILKRPLVSRFVLHGFLAHTSWEKPIAYCNPIPDPTEPLKPRHYLRERYAAPLQNFNFIPQTLKPVPNPSQALSKPYLHDGLLELRCSLAHALPECGPCGNLEREYAGIDIVIVSVVQDRAHVDDREPGKDSGAHHLLQTLQHQE